MKVLLQRTMLPALLAGLIGVAAGMAIKHHRLQPELTRLLKGEEHFRSTFGVAIPSSGAAPGAASKLRAPSGILLVTSVPTSAAIFVDGKKQTQTTPAQIGLPPDRYRITVEKDGLQNTSQGEISDGSIKVLRVVLHQ
ncbi:MAG TPA: PEGA domain-containing protein [Bryobacteraceae bacterium]|nr:PEGA domain-containing protein [Bryobacteraceae bacterium]